ncbi:MAG: AEC family transporter [Kiritimatiellae bacterium]|nr:AEC family transporter [Kiritimatiellia bacterium]MBR0241326.1 AEC family transporter [Kiritimatiellia bacterium]
MQNLATVAAQVGVLFALMAVGAVCRRVRLVDEASVKGIVNVLLLVVTPCLIIDSFQRPFDSSMMHGFFWAFAIAVSAHVAIILFARLFSRGDDRSRPVLRLAMVFSNAGFMGIPLEQAILGAEGVFYGIVYVVVFNFFMWSWGLYEMKFKVESEKFKVGFRAKDLRPMIVNPGTVGIAIGLPLFFASVSLPAILKTPISLLAGLNTPLAMLVIGFYLAGANFRRVVRMPSAYLAAAVRLVVFPLALLALLYPLRSHFPREMMLALVTAASAPVAAMVSMFASKFSRDVDLSVGLVSGTTLLSIFTMPPVIALAMEVL